MNTIAEKHAKRVRMREQALEWHKAGVSAAEIARRLAIGYPTATEIVREAYEDEAEGRVAPSSDLPDDTPLAKIKFSHRTRNALLNWSHCRTAGDVRRMGDGDILNVNHLGKRGVEEIRSTLGYAAEGQERTDRFAALMQRRTTLSEERVKIDREIAVVTAELQSLIAANIQDSVRERDELTELTARRWGRAAMGH